MLRESLDHTGNEPTPDVPIRCSGQDLQNTPNDKYMSFVMNMVIMYYVYQLRTEKEEYIVP